MIALIGTASDGAVARELGISRTTVRRKRELLGIPPYAPPPSNAVECAIPWHPEDLALLGTMPDKDVAEQLGISAGSVILKRQVLKIPPFGQAIRPYQWTPEMLALLGQVPDSRVAELYGMSESAVREKRFRLRLPGVVAGGAVVPTPELIELLQLKCIEVRRLTGLSLTTIGKLRRKYVQKPERWTPELLARLGQESDASLARALGVSATTVLKKRKALGIPSFRATKERSRVK